MDNIDQDELCQPSSTDGTPVKLISENANLFAYNSLLIGFGELQFGEIHKYKMSVHSVKKSDAIEDLKEVCNGIENHLKNKLKKKRGQSADIYPFNMHLAFTSSQGKRFSPADDNGQFQGFEVMKQGEMFDLLEYYNQKFLKKLKCNTCTFTIAFIIAETIIPKGYQPLN